MPYSRAYYKIQSTDLPIVHKLLLFQFHGWETRSSDAKFIIERTWVFCILEIIKNCNRNKIENTSWKVFFSRQQYKLTKWTERIVVLCIYAVHACSFNNKSDYNRPKNTRMYYWPLNMNDSKLGMSYIISFALHMFWSQWYIRGFPAQQRYCTKVSL